MSDDLKDFSDGLPRLWPRSVNAIQDWIAAHDEWKARAEKAEAAIGDVIRDAVEGASEPEPRIAGNGGHRRHGFWQGMGAQANDTLNIFRRHGYGDAE